MVPLRASPCGEPLALARHGRSLVSACRSLLVGQVGLAAEDLPRLFRVCSGLGCGLTRLRRRTVRRVAFGGGQVWVDLRRWTGFVCGQVGVSRFAIEEQARSRVRLRRRMFATVTSGGPWVDRKKRPLPGDHRPLDVPGRYRRVAPWDVLRSTRHHVQPNPTPTHHSGVTHRSRRSRAQQTHPNATTTHGRRAGGTHPLGAPWHAVPSERGTQRATQGPPQG